MSITHTHITTTCYHCGDTCKPEETIFYDDKSFCCNGCQQVYALLQENGLCEYYTMEDLQRISQKDTVKAEKYAYLNLPEIKAKLVDFSDGNIAKITLYVPAIHCSSCIWLLENLHKLNKGIHYSRVDFLKKQVVISFSEKETDLQAIATLMAQIGYEPHITLSDTEKAETEQKKLSREQKQIIAKIAVAGFAFGNIMLISFPEYFGFDSHSESAFRKFFQYVNFVIVLPAFFYSGWGYIRSAYQSIRKGILNIDFPLALGLIVLLLRSGYEIFADVGAGYVDTLAGLIFFLLLGKWFQQRTYDVLRYDRDYKAYFPVAVSVKTEYAEKQVPVTELKVGDRIIIRNQELIPADSILLKGEANIDYSFVTGEAMPVEKVLGEIIYAGGKQVGSTIELEVVKPVSQSYLTELWNKDEFSKQATYKEPTLRLQNFLSKYFTLALLGVAFGGLIFWLWQNDLARAINAFTAVLIIGCPCALALSSPFALGTAMRLMGKAKLYLKNVAVIEKMAQTDTIIFDKTGTITQTDKAQIEWKSEKTTLTEQEKTAIALLARNSTHPLAQHIYQHFKNNLTEINLEVQNFQEFTGKGICGKVGNLQIEMGSAKWLEIKQNAQDYHTKVFVKINGELRGYFIFRNSYRPEISTLTQSLWNSGYDLHLLSGDNAGEATFLVKYFLKNEKMHFNQSPHNKWEFVEKMQQNGKKVMMLGDGLNDAGALQKADVGVAVTENIAYFTPASDAILDASALGKLQGFLQLSRKSMQIIKQSFVISLIYNIIGLSFAVQGTLSPLIAAILMPLSSVTVVAFTTLSVKAKEKWIK